MMPTQDQYTGCLLGLALGDALGAPYEGGVLERALWRLLGRTPQRLPRWTDDTQMTLDLAASLLHCQRLDQDDLARRFAHSYRWSRGYGPSTARVLKRIRRGEHWSTASRRDHASGSFGNGAAMRASVLALFFRGSREDLVQQARRSAEVTHAHRLGVEGGVLIAVAARGFLQRRTAAEILQEVTGVCEAPEFRERLQQVAVWFDTQQAPIPREVAARLGNGMTAPTSCITALYLALRHMDAGFSEMLAFIRACGGDVDTLGAMAGTLWGARHGAAALPDTAIEQQALIVDVATRLYAAAASQSTQASA